jgi:hypothetical protein
VICSATQIGFRIRRSKAPVRGKVERGSLTGPGNPYCRIPVGSTGVAVDALTASDGVGACIGGDGILVGGSTGAADAKGGEEFCGRGDLDE